MAQLNFLHAKPDLEMASLTNTPEAAFNPKSPHTAFDFRDEIVAADGMASALKATSPTPEDLMKHQ